jgi:poly(3-hydroxybutyrate) depolymerase
MQVRSILQAETVTRLLQGAVLGAVATMAIGFYGGGWMLASTASQVADVRAAAAVVAALAPICVEKFQHQQDAAGKLIELKKMVAWNQASFIAAQGWATMPGSGAPKTLAVARACADLLGRRAG